MSLDITLREVQSVKVFEGNITHNLNEMLSQVGEIYYKAVWRPEELGLVHAWQLIQYLSGAVTELKRNPEAYKEFNPANGWGDYDNLVGFLEDYLEACHSHPTAYIHANR